MPEPQSAVYVPVSAVFPDIKADLGTLQSLLQSLSRTDTLVWCARLNLALSDLEMNPFERQKFCMERFLSKEEIQRTFLFAKERESAGHRVRIFSRGQLLELMRWVVLYSQDLPGDGETFDNPQVRRRFSQAAMICSDILDTTIWGTDCGENTARSFLRGDAPDISRKAAGATATTDLPERLGRGWTLFRDYLPKHYPSFDEEFKASTGLSMEQYFACLSMVLVDYAQRRAEGFIYSTVLRRSLFNDTFQQYMGLKSQTPDELRHRLFPEPLDDMASSKQIPPYDKRPLLDKPILRTHHGLAIILDTFFFGESALAGPLFHVIAHSKTKNNDVFSAFGRAFEDYVNDILKRMFQPSDVLAKRLHIEQVIAEHGGCKLEVDACINDCAKVVLIETKSVWMKEEKVPTDDHECYLAYLREKYVEPVSQLARSITALSDPRQSKINSEFNAAELIYPVVIVRDQFLPTPFLDRFLWPEFERCLKPDEILPSKRMKKGQLTVTPPIVIDVETLEGLESCIRHHGFFDLLDDYFQENQDGTMSLHNFIVSSPVYREHFNPRQSVGEKFHEALKSTTQEVFPEADLSHL